jgi:crotonobetainyl-CoA:carnitine CoA-transferase CaiB-like acyl-CoA transferase
VVTATLSAWGADGPWGERRGFDSLVQAASGIAVSCPAAAGGQPGALPAQALDHATGHLIAAAVLRGLAERARTGRPLHFRFALARTASWLLQLPRDPPTRYGRDGPDASAYLVELPSAMGDVKLVRPPGTLDGRPLSWQSGPGPLGSAPPSWR